MGMQAIVITCIAASLLAVVGFVAHRRLAGSVGQPGCLSMFAFVLGWLGMLLAVITGIFLLTERAG
jgi:hypothetical protein